MSRSALSGDRSSRVPAVHPVGKLQKASWSFLSLFGKRYSPPAEEALHEDELGLKWDYEQLARETCARYSVPLDQFRMEAAALGTIRQKRIYVVLVSSDKPEFHEALRIQCLAPSIERRMAEVVRSTWLGDHSLFGGVWTRWPSQIRVPRELRSLLHASRAAAGAHSDEIGMPPDDPRS